MNALSKGFYTTICSGLDKQFEIRLTFRTMEELNAADDELRAIFKGPTRVPVYTNVQEYHVHALQDLLGPFDKVRSLTVEDASRTPPNESS